MMTTEPRRLEVHVLGADRGESIVLRLPDGGWGVVDCCARSSDDRRTNATLQFLQERGVKELEFLCLTHPHDDHYRGMSHLLESLVVRYFWRFNGLSGTHFIRLIEYFRADAEALDRTEEIENAKEFERIFALIGQRKSREGKSSVRVKRVGPAVQLYPVPFDETASFRIIGLAPCGNQVERYEQGLARCFGADGAIRERLPHPRHNLVSAGLLVIFGETRVILGGDVERDAWTDVIAEMGKATLAAHAVKVNHHGSPTGYCDGLWSHFSADHKPSAVVTAYTSQGLPRQSALDHIRPHVSTMFTTCLTALKDHQLPVWTDPQSSRLRLALRAKMGRVGVQSHHGCGRCSLTFDDRGRCVSTAAVAPAGTLTASVKIQDG